MSEPLRPTDRDRLTEALKADQGRLVGFARRRLPDDLADQDAEDVLSDVVLRLLERADLLAEVENVTAYLFTALANRIADLFRKKREQPLPENAPEPPVPEDAEEQLGLSQALSLLGTAERAVWMAVEMEGFSFRELAERWDEPIGTLLSRKARATKTLRRLLAEPAD
ncbi:MAG TPA: sigma-70 family RNA polymerase sigma factor [Candidatus Sulfotelmatobacter sp.]|jgi:RNA polymerase sigma factor (sigma-70 family)|nr:sigma-70 family RNA polymerase sigma factor [Candidatus Sulfotelmatobacter sp.]